MTNPNDDGRLTRRDFLARSAAAAGAAWLAGHSATPSWAAPAPAGAVQRPSSGGTLRVTLGAEPTTLDPHQTRTVFDADIRHAMFDGLLYDDFTDGPKGAIAESWEAQSASAYVFRLRRGVRFHDGGPVNAEVVKASLERAATAGQAVTRTLAEQISAVDVLDPNSVRVRLKGPNAAFLVDVADIKIVPRTFDPQRPAGTGPFQFVEWVRLRHVRARKFAGHWRDGMPYLDEVVFQPTPDENQKLALLEAGQVDFIDTIPLPRVREVERAGRLKIHEIPAGVSPSAYFMLLRADRAPLNNVKVRQAINFGIDRKALLDVTFGKGTIKSNAIPPKHWAYNPESVSFNERDVARARKLLSEAGVSNLSLQLKHITSRAEFATIAQVFQANMAEIGIRIDIVPQEIGIWINQVNVQRDFQLGLTGVIPRYDPDGMLGALYSKHQVNGKSIGWVHELFEKQLEQGRSLFKEEDRKRVYRHAQLIAQWEAPGLILNERPILYGSSQAVQGFVADVRQHTRFHNVWLRR